MSNQRSISRFRPGFIPLFTFFICLFLLISVGPGSTQGFAAQVTLAWDANTDPAVAGYKLYYGKASRTYGTPVNVGKVTQYTLSNIQEGVNCYFAVTAYDTSGNESAFSTELECFTLVPTPTINGTISPSSAVVVSRGMNQVFTVTPAINYAIADVLMDTVSAGPVATYSFSNVDRNHSLSASFASVGYSHMISASAGANGSISPSGSVSVTHGASQVFTITASTGYQVKDVLVDGTSVGAVASYTFSNVTATHSIIASFVAKTDAISQSGWTLHYVDSQELTGENGAAENAFDGNSSTIWHTKYYGSSPSCPHEIQISLGAKYGINGFRYLPRQDGGINGTIKQYAFYVSADGTNWGTAVASGTFAGDTTQKEVTFSQVTGSFIRIVALSEINGNPWSSMAEINVLGALSGPTAQTYAITASAGTNGAISPSGGLSVTQGASKVFTITPTTGYQVKDVLVDGTSVGAVTTYTFSNITAAHTIAASFVARTYAIAASAGTNGSISPSGSVSVTQGGSQAFAITASTGYQVKDVLVDGTSVGAVTTYTFSNVTAAHTIAASFVARTYAIAASAGTNGSISPSGSVSVTQGGSQAFAITASTGYQVKDVLVDGTSVGAVTTYTFSNVTAAHTIAASFVARTYAIAASAGTNGSISPSGSVSVTQGGSQALTITASTGYQVKDVLVDGTSVGAVTTYTFSNVTAAHTIAASFVARTYAIAASAGTNGSISPSGSVSVTQGGSQAFTITASTGYQVKDVLVDGTSVGAVTTYTFSNVTAAHTIAASFVARTYAIAASAGTNGSISPSGSVSVTQGASQAFTITANSGYQIQDVKVDGTSVGAVASYTFSNVTATHSIIASFVAKSDAISQSGWTLHYVDSQELTREIGAAVNAFDGNSSTIWHTKYYGSSPSCPHEIQISLGAKYGINGFRYLPRQDGGINGTIKQYAFYVSADGTNWGTAVAAGTFAGDTREKEVTFSQVTGSFIRLVALSEINGNPWSSMAEINVLGALSGPTAQTYAITASAGTNGAISPAGGFSVTQGASQAFTITANSGYQIQDVKVDGTSVGAVASYTFSNVTATHSIIASFVAKSDAISQSGWTLHYVDSQELTREIGAAVNAFDGNSSTIWHTKYYGSSPSCPHEIQISLGAKYGINGFRYLPRQDGGINGTIKQYAFYVSADGTNWGTAVAAGTFAGDTREKEVTFSQVTGSFIRLVALSEINGNPWSSMAEINVLGALSGPTAQTYAITASAGTNGAISPAGGFSVTQGASQAFTITANSGYQIQDVKVDGTSAGAVINYTFSNVQANHSISATFILDGKTQTVISSMTDALSSQKTGTDSSYLLAGSGKLPGNGGWIEVLNPQGDQAALPVHIDWLEYNKLSGEMRIATGDIDGDGRDEIVVGLGPVTGAPGIPGGYFAVLDEDYSVIGWGQVEWPEYNQINGETRVACGDIDGDGIAEIIVGLGPGGEGRLEVFKLIDHQLKHVKWLQTGWQDYNKGNGETRPSCGDLDGNGTDEVIVGLGPVKDKPGIPGGVFYIFDQTSAGSTDLRDSSQSDASGWGVINWPDYNSINGESWPACGDVNADGKKEIVLSLGKEGAGRFEILGFDMQQNSAQPITWQQSLLSSGVEVRPACGKLDTGDGDEIIIGFSKGGAGIMEVFGTAAQNFQSLRQVQTQFTDPLKLESQLWPAVFKLGNQ